jgi:large subunit ribosomal protein L7/L12
MELSKNAQKVFDLVKELTAVELASLVKSLEEEFGVTAASMVVAGGAAASDDDGAGAAKDSFDVELTEVGQQKIAVIKVVKELLGVSLPEAKDMVEKAPTIVKAGVKGDEAETFKIKLTDAGAVVTLK